MSAALGNAALASADRWQVVCTWADGRRTVWSSYADEKTAWTAAARLCVAAVAAEVVDRDATPADSGVAR